MRLTAENSDLKAARKLQAKENEQLPRTPSEKLNHSLTQSLDEMKRRNSELEKEIARFENLCTMLEEDSDAHKHGEFSDSSASSTSTTLSENDMIFKLREELEGIETKLQQAQPHWKCLKDENNALQQKLAEMVAAQEKCEMLECKIQQHEEQILSLKTHMDQNMVECSKVEKHRKAIERQHRCQVMEETNKVNRLLQVTTVICHVL
jgi:predicted  nucleic acid-binding Zn-ribbon protein